MIILNKQIGLGVQDILSLKGQTRSLKKTQKKKKKTFYYLLHKTIKFNLQIDH